jgi:hypothetical protein
VTAGNCARFVEFTREPPSGGSFRPVARAGCGAVRRLDDRAKRFGFFVLRRHQLSCRSVGPSNYQIIKLGVILAFAPPQAGLYSADK